MYSKHLHCYILLILGWLCYDIVLIAVLCLHDLQLHDQTCSLRFQEGVSPIYILILSLNILNTCSHRLLTYSILFGMTKKHMIIYASTFTHPQQYKHHISHTLKEIMSSIQIQSHTGFSITRSTNREHIVCIQVRYAFRLVELVSAFIYT